MIEYDKFKEINDLVYSLDGISLTISINKDSPIYFDLRQQNGHTERFYSETIVRLIDRLNKIKKDAPLYKVGDEVMYIHPLTSLPVAEKIKGVRKTPLNETQYLFSHYAIMQDDLIK